MALNPMYGRRRARPRRPCTAWRCLPRWVVSMTRWSPTLPSWVGGVADSEGGVPFVLPTALGYPRAPWMVPDDGGSHLTFGLVAQLTAAESDTPWLRQATDWCWGRLSDPAALGGYWLKFALEFLDSQPDDSRALEATESLRPLLGPDGTVPVPGGVEGEQLSALTLSPRPGSHSRALFTDEQIARGLVPAGGAAARGRRLGLRLAGLVTGPGRRVARPRDTAGAAGAAGQQAAFEGLDVRWHSDLGDVAITVMVSRAEGLEHGPVRSHRVRAGGVRADGTHRGVESHPPDDFLGHPAGVHGLTTGRSPGACSTTVTAAPRRVSQ